MMVALLGVIGGMAFGYWQHSFHAGLWMGIVMFALFVKKIKKSQL